MRLQASQKKISRKQFFRRLGLLLLIPLLYLWRSTLKNDEAKHNKSRKIRVGESIPAGVTFLGNAILVNKGKPLALSSKCSHLGCTINNRLGEELVCPCHGSRYNLKGEVLKGPAAKPLTKLNLTKQGDIYFIES